ncbi:NAD(P)-binding protein [Auricularia subglabra TFB-10046 SS5]|nr:NAD(P)-binding protein [Auricularia subglabra TFB-10046 SS5]
MNFLITGAARGIGRGLARSLLLAGHRRLHTASLACNWADRRAYESEVVDLADREQLKAAVKNVREFCGGRLDVLVNNAFPTPHTWADGKTMEDPDADIEAQWDAKVAVGLTAPFLLSRLCVPLLRRDDPAERPGCIINISSTRARQAENDHEAYSAVKAGLLGLTTSMAVSLGHRHKIRVNALSLSWINAANECKAADEGGVKWEDELTVADHAWHPGGKVGRIEDVVKAVLFAAESDFLTEENITLDGGVSKKMVYPEE